MAGAKALLGCIFVCQIVLLSAINAEAAHLEKIGETAQVPSNLSVLVPVTDSYTFSDPEAVTDSATEAAVTEAVVATTVSATDSVTEEVPATEGPDPDDARTLLALDTLLIRAEQLSVSESGQQEDATLTKEKLPVSAKILEPPTTAKVATTPSVKEATVDTRAVQNTSRNATVSAIKTTTASTISEKNPPFELIYGKAYIPGVGRGDAYTPHELRLITKLRARLENDLTQPHMHMNKFFIRFLRARRMNVDGAEVMIRKALEWRRIEKIDTILSEDFSWWERNYPFFFPLDRDGRPGVASGIGGLNLRKYVLANRAPQVLRYIYYGLEKSVHNGVEQSNRTGIEYNYGHLLFDLSGYSARNHACVACVPYLLQFVQNYENYWPQVGKRIIGINAPRLFENALNMARPFISAVTQSAIRLFGYNKNEWRPELLKIFPPENLTPEFGGTLKFRPGVVGSTKSKHHS